MSSTLIMGPAGVGSTFTMGQAGLSVGPPLKQFHGILTGIPIVQDR